MGGTTVVIDGRIVTLGGQVQHGTAISAVYSYHPATNQWSELNNLPVNRHSAVAGVINGVIYYTTGNSSKTYKGVPVAP
jgi:N-acetylneuraminic acid mutarotase